MELDIIGVKLEAFLVNYNIFLNCCIISMSFQNL